MIDTADKRFSMMAYDLVIGHVYPAPSGPGISSADAQQWIGKYRGIPFLVISAAVAAESFIPVMRRRRR